MDHIYLIADIGGTNARLALCSRASKEIRDLRVYSCNTGISLEEVIGEYLQSHVELALAGVCLAVPGPIDEGTSTFVNNEWVIDRQHLEQVVKSPVMLLNDFSAQALALVALQDADFDWLDELRPRANSIKALVGPGTGTGVGAVLPNGQVIPSEGGHIAFAPINQHQDEMLRYTRGKFGRASVERFISGPGLINIYQFHQARIGVGIDKSTQPGDITQGAENGDELALESIAGFWDIAAAYAGDIALIFGARGGVYVSGGVAQKLTPYLDKHRFRRIFSDKGRFSEFCAGIAIGICLEQQMGLTGCRQHVLDQMYFD